MANLYPREVSKPANPPMQKKKKKKIANKNHHKPFHFVDNQKENMFFKNPITVGKNNLQS